MDKLVEREKEKIFFKIHQNYDQIIQMEKRNNLHLRNGFHSFLDFEIEFMSVERYFQIFQPTFFPQHDKHTSNKFCECKRKHRTDFILFYSSVFFYFSFQKLLVENVCITDVIDCVFFWKLWKLWNWIHWICCIWAKRVSGIFIKEVERWKNSKQIESLYDDVMKMTRICVSDCCVNHEVEKSNMPLKWSCVVRSRGRRASRHILYHWKSEL